VEEEHTKTFKDYYNILNRRRKQFFYPFIILFIITLIIAVLLPSIYRSSATILIESQDVPSEMVASTVTSYAKERLQIISQRAMATNNLAKIIKKFDLYPDDINRLTKEEIIGNMRNDIKLETTSEDVIDPRDGRPKNITIAFTLSYDSKNQVHAQQVATELTSLYLSENIRERTNKASQTSGFLNEEGDKLKNKISLLEKKLAEFKQKNIRNLPELTQFNIQMLERTERDLLEVQRQIRAIEERRVILHADLAQINPFIQMVSSTGERIMKPVDRLKALEADYVSKSGIYAKNHPDLIRLQREITSLRKENVYSSDTTLINSRLIAVKGELAQSREIHSANHPDVRRLESVISGLQLELSNIGSQSKDIISKPDNPVYIQITAQINTADSEFNSLKVALKNIYEKRDIYEERIISTPQIERTYKSLSRNYINALAKYQQIKTKQLHANLAEELEKDSKGERFTIIEPPLFPEIAEKPNRIAIIFLGVILSIAGGILIVSISEMIDPVIHGMKSVIHVLGAAPLVSIPYIGFSSEFENNQTNYKIFNRRNMIYASIVFILISSLLTLI